MDTLPHEAPPAPELFRPESRKGPVAPATMLRVLGFGVAAGLLPAILANSRLDNKAVDVRAVAVGLTVGVAGLTGAVRGRRLVPIPENVEYNRGLKSTSETQNHGIAARNEQLRRSAPLRIRAVIPP